MHTYEYPLGVVFRAATPEHAAAHVFGGKPGDYIATVQTIRWDNSQIVEVTNYATGEFLGDIPILNEADIAGHKREGSF